MCGIVGYVGDKDKDAAPLLTVLDITRATASRSSSAPTASTERRRDCGRRRRRILLALREIDPPGALEPVPDDTILDDVLIPLRIAGATASCSRPTVKSP